MKNKQKRHVGILLGILYYFISFFQMMNLHFYTIQTAIDRGSLEGFGIIQKINTLSF